MTRIRYSARSARATPGARARGRRGVTLVEMLVATAMCILGMWMLTWMFQQATASFSLANQQATLTGQERMVTTIMTRDLEANKFPEDDNFSRGGRGQKLSDYYGGAPKGGYFLAGSFTPGNVVPAANNLTFLEATDSYNFASTRAGNHFLQFTVIRPDTPGNRFSATSTAIAGATTAGVAVEVSYFLVPTGVTSTGAKLFDLMRVQRLIAQSQYDQRDYLSTVVQPWYAAGDKVDEVMASDPAYPSATPPVPAPRMYTLRDVISPTPPPPPPAAPLSARFQRAARPTSSGRYGEDRLLSNVLSLEVKFTGPTVSPASFAPTPEPWPTTGPYGSSTNANSPPVWPRPFDPVTTPTGTYLGNKDYPYDFLPFDGQFDTGDPNGPMIPAGSGPPQPTRQPLVGVTGVQIRIRALFGTTARQTTIIVAL